MGLAVYVEQIPDYTKLPARVDVTSIGLTVFDD